MTKIKLCGLSRTCDIEAVNELKPAYIGFVFAKNSRRFVPSEKAAHLKKMLSPDVLAAGIFVNEPIESVISLLRQGIIDLAQLHGDENEEYIRRLRLLTSRPVIKAFRIKTAEDLSKLGSCPADHILLDAGAGTGSAFDWNVISGIRRPFFLAGGLDVDNVQKAIRQLHPFAVDVSSGIETDGVKDRAKMAAFVEAVRKEDRLWQKEKDASGSMAASIYPKH